MRFRHDQSFPCRRGEAKPREREEPNFVRTGCWQAGNLQPGEETSHWAVLREVKFINKFIKSWVGAWSCSLDFWREGRGWERLGGDGAGAACSPPRARQGSWGRHSRVALGI